MTRNQPLSPLQFASEGEMVYARFTRPALLEFVNPETGAMEVNDLDSESWYLLMSAGAVLGDVPMEHDEEGASSEIIDFCGGDCDDDDDDDDEDSSSFVRSSQLLAGLCVLASSVLKWSGVFA